MSIKSFTHRGVEEFFCEGHSRKVGTRFRGKLNVVLSAIDAATCAADLRGAHGFHQLKGDRTGTYAMSVTANRRLTFLFENGDKGDVVDVDFEDYH
jgi:proteic killer suppression protein